MLGALYDALDPLVAAAIAVCWSARDAFAASVEARQRLSRAQASADSSCDQLRANFRHLMGNTVEMHDPFQILPPTRG